MATLESLERRVPEHPLRCASHPRAYGRIESGPRAGMRGSTRMPHDGSTLSYGAPHLSAVTFVDCGLIRSERYSRWHSQQRP